MANQKKSPDGGDSVVGKTESTDGPIGEAVLLDAQGLEPVMVAPRVEAKPAPKPNATPTPAHHTRCTVVGTDVVSGGRMFSAGTVADFPNSDVASLPDILIPVAE